MRVELGQTTFGKKTKIVSGIETKYYNDIPQQLKKDPGLKNAGGKIEFCNESIFFTKSRGLLKKKAETSMLELGFRDSKAITKELIVTAFNGFVNGLKKVKK